MHMHYVICQQVDYWSDDFDSGQNCEKNNEIEKLKRMNPSQCKIVNGETDEEAFSKCKRHLTTVLQKKCEFSEVKNPGELFYCKIRGRVTCCFGNESCKTWFDIYGSFTEKGREYLMNRTNVLNNLVKITGYKTCHHLKSLDASKCANDCKKFEKGKFARNCKSTGGLFKCCIRRDKWKCHECRYCCTLPMCTKSPGRVSFKF